MPLCRGGGGAEGGGGRGGALPIITYIFSSSGLFKFLSLKRK